MKFKLLPIGLLAMGLMSCHSNSGETISNGSLKSAHVDSSITAKCFLKGGIASLSDDIPREIANGTTHQIHVTLTCKNNAQFDVTENIGFEINNASILNIDKKKLISAKVAGNTFITYSYNAGDTIRRDISVANSIIKNISLSTDATAFEVGETIKLKASAILTDDKEAEDLDPMILTWKSSNPQVATVDNNGNVKLISKGSVTITADYKQHISAKYEINVNAAALTNIIVTPKENITLDQFVNSTVNIGANAEFADKTQTAIDQDQLKCTSSNDKIAKFDGCSLELVGTIVKSDNIKVTVFYKNKTAEKNIEISTGKVSGLLLDVDGSNLLPNSTPRKYAVLIKSDTKYIPATDKIPLVSSNPSILEVKNGQIIPLKAGKVTLSATYTVYENNKPVKDLTDSKDVTVGNVDVNFPDAFPKGSEYSLSVKVINEKGVSVDKTNEANISSNDSNIIQVINKNTLVAKNIGEATIHVSLADGVTVTKKVSVDNAVVKSITIKGVPDSIKLGYTTSLAVVAKYSDGEELEVANSADVTWAATPIDIIAVTNGVLKPLKIGVGTVKATYRGHTATNSVNVDDAELTKLEVNPSQIKLFAGENFKPAVKAIFSDGSSQIIDNTDLKCNIDGSSTFKIPYNCVVNSQSTDASATLHIAYGTLSASVLMTSHKDLPPIKDMVLNISRELFVGGTYSYAIILNSTDGRAYNVTNLLDLISSNNDKLKVDRRGTVKAQGVDNVQLSVKYDNKAYATKQVRVSNGRIINADIQLVDNKGNVANNSDLMPHKEYTIKIKSCTNENDITIPANQCELKFSLSTNSVAANLEGMKLTPFLAGNIILHEGVINHDYTFKVSAIRNDEYEVGAGSFSQRFHQVTISDEDARGGYDVVNRDIDDLKIRDKISDDLTKQGRYEIIDNITYHDNMWGVHWLDFVLKKETNRSIPIYYAINNDTICHTTHGVWRKNDKFTSAEFKENADSGAWQTSTCSGSNREIHHNVCHGTNALRVKYDAK